MKCIHRRECRDEEEHYARSVRETFWCGVLAGVMLGFAISTLILMCVRV
jgi:hypothetical protein